MRDMLSLLAFVAVTIFCWGIYGPVLHEGQVDMKSLLKPFICVGLAYFVIAVVVPVAILAMRGEKGQWTATGLFWSFLAGIVTAVGALGIILAFAFRGNPVYVMPLVFGGAPVVNTLFTMISTRNLKVNPIFIAGLMLVVTGAVTVLAFKPRPHSAGQAVEVTRNADGSVHLDVTTAGEGDAPPVVVPYDAAGPDELKAQSPAAYELYLKHARLNAPEMAIVFGFTLLTVICWGIYGPTLHKGQVAMHGSRLRPFLCVGLSYFLIAVLVPVLILAIVGDAGSFTFKGTMWSLAGGAAGAFGALGIIMAFNSGGKPIFVMPLVFAGAPVVNTFISVYRSGSYGELHPIFFAGLILVVVGAVNVLIFAPRGGHGPATKPDKPSPQPEVAHS